MYQLTRLDRVPAHAAVQATVEVAKRSGGGTRAASLVNAVLRRVARGEGEAAPLPGERVARLARLFSHPEWLVDRWVRRYGIDSTRALLDHNNRKPPLVLQPVRWTREQLEDRLSQRGVHVKRVALGARHRREGAGPARL
jgi:16S rRNA (cytosine967-C5)-methyltransferase